MELLYIVDGAAAMKNCMGVPQKIENRITSLKATLWMKAQHEGALTPLCIVRKNPQLPHTAQQVACPQK